MRKIKIKKEILEKAEKIIRDMFPQVSEKNFFISNFKTSKIFTGKLTDVYEMAVGDTTKNSLLLYRKPKEKSTTLYKVDELNIQSNKLRSHKKINNHYTEYNISDDIMNRSQMTIDFISNENGDLVPNIQPDGMVQVYVNFPDPMEEIKRNILKKKK